MDNQSVSFPDWKDALAHAGLGAAREGAFLREIISFLKHCKTQRSPATIPLAKAYVEQHEKTTAGPVREALRWFFRAAKSGSRDGRIGAPAATRLRPMEPKPAAQDRGDSAWEQALVGTMRLRGLLWRTEYTYRRWAQRFARFIAPKTPYAAGAEEVGAFLTDLAVRTRASASAQRQALNALVFLMEEALHRELGELDFKRAVQRERVPTVLTPDECRRIFTQLSGTHRLMAELAYGAGLRLMELLRLRVQHLDLDR